MSDSIITTELLDNLFGKKNTKLQYGKYHKGGNDNDDDVILNSTNVPQNHIDSTTSPINSLSDVINEINQNTFIPSIYEQPIYVEPSHYDVYHIILDCDFGIRNKLHTHKNPVFGKLRNVLNEQKIPVLFNLDEATIIANRLIDQTVNMGSISDKKYPVFGAVILGLRLQNIKVKQRNANTGGGSTDYSLLNLHEDYDLIIYKVKGNERGVLARNTLEKAELLSAKYVTKLNTQMNVGFSLHNLNTNLSSSDIQLLKKLYDNNGQLMLFNTSTTSQGGSKNDYKSMYLQEKKRYLQLKELAKKRNLLK